MTVGPYNMGRFYRKSLLTVYFYKCLFVFVLLSSGDAEGMFFTIYLKTFNFTFLRFIVIILVYFRILSDHYHLCI